MKQPLSSYFNYFYQERSDAKKYRVKSSYTKNYNPPRQGHSINHISSESMDKKVARKKKSLTNIQVLDQTISPQKYQNSLGQYDLGIRNQHKDRFAIEQKLKSSTKKPKKQHSLSAQRNAKKQAYNLINYSHDKIAKQHTPYVSHQSDYPPHKNHFHLPVATNKMALKLWKLAD